MPYLPPNFRYTDCLIIDPTYVANNRLICQIKDENGNILATYEYRRIADTTVFCAEIETPSTEGTYAMDYKIVDAAGNLVYELYDDVLVVSTTESIHALLNQIIALITGQVIPKLDAIQERVSRIALWIQTRKA